MLIDRSRSTYSLIARERVVFSKEKHTVARLGLSHRNARAVPVSFLHFLLLIIIEATGTQRCSKCYLVLGETLDHNSGHRHIRAVLGIRLFYVLVAECRHGFESLVHFDLSLFISQTIVLPGHGKGLMLRSSRGRDT